MQIHFIIRFYLLILAYTKDSSPNFQSAIPINKSRSGLQVSHTFYNRIVAYTVCCVKINNVTDKYERSNGKDTLHRLGPLHMKRRCTPIL